MEWDGLKPTASKWVRDSRVTAERYPCPFNISGRSSKWKLMSVFPISKFQGIKSSMDRIWKPTWLYIADSCINFWYLISKPCDQLLQRLTLICLNKHDDINGLTIHKLKSFQLCHCHKLEVQHCQLLVQINMWVHLLSYGQKTYQNWQGLDIESQVKGYRWSLKCKMSDVMSLQRYLHGGCVSTGYGSSFIVFFVNDQK